MNMRKQYRQIGFILHRPLVIPKSNHEATVVNHLTCNVDIGCLEARNKMNYIFLAVLFAHGSRIVATDMEQLLLSFLSFIQDLYDLIQTHSMSLN